MKQIVVSLCLSLCAIFLFVAQAHAQENPVNGLEIKVVTKSGEVAATAKSRADGSFSFTIKEIGDYYVVADEAALSRTLTELVNDGAPVAIRKAKKASKKASQKTAQVNEQPEADVDLVAAFETNLKYDVRPAGATLVVRKKIEKSSPMLYVSKTNTPVMGKVTWSPRSN